MLKIAKFFCACVLGLCVTGVNAMDFSQSNNLIIYFSLKHNQGRADAAQIETNNQRVAQTLNTLVSAEIFELQTQQAYPLSYRESTDQASQEQRQNARPALAAIPDVSQAENIFLIYPNWWSSYPMAFATLFDSVDLSGKTIIPICTHEGSRLGRSVSDMQQALPNSKIVSGLAIRGGSVFDDDLADTLKSYLESL